MISKAVLLILTILLIGIGANSQSDSVNIVKDEFTFRKDQKLLSKNIFVLPRPGAIAAGMSFKVKESKLSIGPWVEYLNAKSNANTIAVKAQSLGVLANYTFSKKGAYGIGPTLLFIASVDRSQYKSDLGSEMTSNTILAGGYFGFQYTSKIRLNIWLGMGVLGLVPLNVKESIKENEIQDAIDNLNSNKSDRLFPFPGIMIGYAF